jgi:ParB family chromosome partitioning protein
MAHATRLAGSLSLDMSAQWSATQDNYLGRVTKSQILNAVREAKGSAAARMIEHLKKGDMAQEAERLLAGTGWLPALLRTPGVNDEAAGSACEDHTHEQDAPSDVAFELPALLTADGGAADVYSVAAE